VRRRHPDPPLEGAGEGGVLGVPQLQRQFGDRQLRISSGAQGATRVAGKSFVAMSRMIVVSLTPVYSVALPSVRMSVSRKSSDTTSRACRPDRSLKAFL